MTDNNEKSFRTKDPVLVYINEHSLRLTNEQKKLIDRTVQLSNCNMLGSADEIQLFQLILKAINAKKVIEVGTYTGYSTLTMALALPDDAKIIACDITDEFIATDIWKEAGVDHKIDIKIGPAIDTLNNLIASGMEGQFDFVFIDADKPMYLEYYEASLKLLRKGGIIALDNVLWSNKVADLNCNDDFTVLFRKINDFVKNDNRVDISMLRLGDGTTFCLKK